MFWLNSRGSLVTATSSSLSWHHFSRSYVANLPSSLASINADTPWTSHPGAPVSVLGTDIAAVSTPIFTGTRDRLKGAFAPLLVASPGSRHYGSPRDYALEQIGAPAQLTPMRQDVRRGRNGAGILTCLPFRRSRLRNALGSTNPRLTNSVEEPLPLRRSGFSPLFAATPTRILIRTRSIRPHGRTSARARRLPTRLPLGTLKYRWLT